MVAEQRAFMKRLSVPYPSQPHHLPTPTVPDVMAGYYCHCNLGRPSSTAIYPLFICCRCAAADQTPHLLNMEDVYSLVQIHEHMITRSFVIRAIRPQSGQRKLLTCGAECLQKRHMDVIAMEG